MKKILFFLFFGILLSCEESSVGPSTPNNPTTSIPTSLANLNLTGTKNLFPYMILSTNNVAVFVNDLGEEKRLNYFYKSGMEARVYKGISYESEYYKVDYIDSTNLIYSLAIDVETKYTSYTKTSEVLSAAILTQVNPSFLSSVLIDENGDALLAKKLDQVKIGGINFNNVYTDVVQNNQGYNSFAETYYSPELGFVAFQGENGEMWALKRYEKQ